MTIEFRDPPPRVGGGKYAAARAALIERSGEWALIATVHDGNAQSMAARIRGSKGPWAGHDWEVQLVRISLDMEMYVRHVGHHATSEGAS